MLADVSHKITSINLELGLTGEPSLRRMNAEKLQ